MLSISDYSEFGTSNSKNFIIPSFHGSIRPKTSMNIYLTSGYIYKESMKISNICDKTEEKKKPKDRCKVLRSLSMMTNDVDWSMLM